MAEYPRALRIAHRIVYFHPSDAQAFVAGKLAEAAHAKDPAQAAEWRKISHFVDRLLGDAGLAAAPTPHRARHVPRYRRLRAPGPR